MGDEVVMLRYGLQATEVKQKKCEYPDCRENAVVYGMFVEQSVTGGIAYRLSLLARIYHGWIFVCAGHDYVVEVE
jgi:hypothetical protein